MKKPSEIPSRDELFRERILLSSREVAHIIGRSTLTLERWRRKKQGPPFIRLNGARVAYPVDKLREWLQGQLTDQPFAEDHSGEATS